MSFKGTRRTDGPDKPLDSLREMSNRTWKYHVFFSCLLTQGDQHRLTNRIFFFFFFFSNIYAWQPMTFFPEGVQRRIYFITAAPTDIRHRIVIFHSYAVPSNHLCSLVPSKLILTISICDSLSAMPPPFHSFRSLSAEADRGTRGDYNGG